MYIIYNSAPAADTQGFWWGYPLRLATLASSPKGTPLGYAGNCIITLDTFSNRGKGVRPLSHLR